MSEIDSTRKQLENIRPTVTHPELSSKDKSKDYVPLDRYGFMHTDSRFEKKKERKLDIWLENSRTKKWIVMLGPNLEKWESTSRNQSKRLKKRIRKGIPDAVRGRIWCRISNSCTMMKNNPNIYDDYLSQVSGPCFDAIQRDIGRTYPNHHMFGTDAMGQKALSNVLKAYSLHDPEVGYCQGMGFICALFLSYMPEEQTFWHLVACMTSKKICLADIFRPGMPKVGETMYTFDRLLQKHLPRIHSHFDKELLHPTMYASQWFITIYSYNFPFDIVTRVWDMFLYEGWKVIYRIALALLKLNSVELLKLDFERSMDFFHRLALTVQPDELMRTAIGIKMSSKEMDKLHEQYLDSIRK